MISHDDEKTSKENANNGKGSFKRYTAAAIALGSGHWRACVF